MSAINVRTVLDTERVQPEAETEVQISIRNLQVHYGPTHAVKDVTLDVPEGAVRDLVGHGRDTILRFERENVVRVVEDRPPIHRKCWDGLVFFEEQTQCQHPEERKIDHELRSSLRERVECEGHKDTPSKVARAALGGCVEGTLVEVWAPTALATERTIDSVV